MVSPLRHGGALHAATARWGGARADWLDLSTGINPIPTPHASPPPEAWTRLPEVAAERALEAAARRAYHVPDASCIVAAPGTQAILQWLPRLRPAPLDVAVVGPTYAEHARCWALAGHLVREVPEPCEADVLVVVNPNNPDGRERDPASLVDRARVLTVIDEAFRDATPGRSAVPLGRRRTIVLRSLGKFHGLAGLRLGHAIGPAESIAPLAEALGPWAVSGPALDVGAQVLAADPAPVIAGLRARGERLRATLAAHGLEIVGATDFFALVRHPHAGALHEALAGRSILTRPFDGRPEWLRFGQPPEVGFARLDRALGEAPAEMGEGG